MAAGALWAGTRAGLMLQLRGQGDWGEAARGLPGLLVLGCLDGGGTSRPVEDTV